MGTFSSLLLHGSCVVCWWHEVVAPFRGRRTTLSLRSLGRENCFAVTGRCCLRTKSEKLFPSRPSFLRRRTSTGFASRRFSLWQSENQKDSRLGRVKIIISYGTCAPLTAQQIKMVSREACVCATGPSELESRGLTVNCEKTVAMLIYPSSSKTSALPSINIACGRTTIPFVDSTRMLGVIIDSNLSWKEHVDHVCLKVNRKIGALRRSFRQLCPVARRLFYLSIIQPDFDFGSSAFIPNILMSQRKRLVATWRRAVRAVAGRGYQEDVAPLWRNWWLTPLNTDGPRMQP